MTATYSRATALLLSVLLFISLIPLSALGEEGMFLPNMLNELPLKKLQQRGLKIPIADIYNPNGPSIKDAVVIVDGGTGEFLSPEGLLLTNHHVAFDALVAASDPAKDYASNGYFAHNHSEELPAKGYTVQITQELKDVTAEVLAGITDVTSPQDRAAAIASKSRAIATAASKPSEGITARVLPLNEGLSYYLFTYLTLRDVRIIYAPPKNIGFFGGDPDNFEWPRHDGDFTFMRVYVGPDGKPADFSASNVPYKPKKFLSISMGGVKENDFVMVMGYPGSTRRYRESYSIAYNQEVGIPFQIDVFRKQLEVLENLGRTNRELQIRLQSRIFDIANTLKDLEGSVVAMRRFGVVEQKRTQETALIRWINENPDRQKKYAEVLPSLQKAYDDLQKTQPRDSLIQQMAGLSDTFQIAALIAALSDMTAAQLRQLNEPLIDFAAEIVALNMQAQDRARIFNRVVATWRPLLVQANSEMRGTTPYPDANRTLRFTYGEVKGYIPH